MPNWVYNSLAVQGNAEQIKNLKTQLNQPFSVTHDSWNIETGQMEKKPTTYNNPIFAFWNITKPTDLDTYFGEQPKYDPNKPIAFDSDHWYDWNVRNWGTKWDVANQDGDSPYNDTSLDDDEETSVIYSFNTAWSMPTPAIKNLSSQYPELIFNLFYQEETGWGGEVEIMNGSIIREADYESKCPECDSMDCLSYNDEKGVEVCSQCDYES
jgi:hypothetical protein